MIVATMDFMVNATNVYRTKGFIVKQEMRSSLSRLYSNTGLYINHSNKRFDVSLAAFFRLKYGKNAFANVRKSIFIIQFYSNFFVE